MSDDDIIRSMRNTSDEELLAITSGAALGYTAQARAIAEGVLRERRVQLPADLKDLRKRAAAAEAEANRHMADLDAVGDRAVGRALGKKLLVIGVGTLLLPIFELHSLVVRPYGLVTLIAGAIIAIVGYILFVRTSEDPSQTPPHNER